MVWTTVILLLYKTVRRSKQIRFIVSNIVTANIHLLLLSVSLVIDNSNLMQHF